jgi:hypothetical protein
VKRKSARRKKKPSAVWQQEKAQLETQTAEARRTIAAEADRLADKISSNILRA